MGSPRVIKTAKLLSRRNCSRRIRSICLMVSCKNVLSRVLRVERISFAFDEISGRICLRHFARLLWEMPRNRFALSRSTIWHTWIFFRSLGWTAIKPCVNLSDCNIWQYGVKPEMKFHRVLRRRVRLQRVLGPDDRSYLARREKSGPRMASNMVIKLPGLLT